MTIYRDTLRGLHNVLIFRRFLEMRFSDIWNVYENYYRDLNFLSDKAFFLNIEPLQPISSKKMC